MTVCLHSHSLSLLFLCFIEHLFYCTHVYSHLFLSSLSTYASLLDSLSLFFLCFIEFLFFLSSFSQTHSSSPSHSLLFCTFPHNTPTKSPQFSYSLFRLPHFLLLLIRVHFVLLLPGWISISMLAGFPFIFFSFYEFPVFFFLHKTPISFGIYIFPSSYLPVASSSLPTPSISS